MRISSSCRAKIDAVEQILASKWAIFYNFEMAKSDFCRAKVPLTPPPKTKHEVAPLATTGESNLEIS